MSDFLDKCRSYMGAGGAPFIKKATQKLFHVDLIKYNLYLKNHKSDERELKKQRDVSREAPLISIVVPVYRTKPEFFKRLIRSVLASSYENWELCIADGSGYKKGDEHYYDLQRILMEDKYADVRIHYLRLKENLGIAGNTNAAIETTRGTWVVFCDHDDEISPEALYHIWNASAINPAAELIYSDEDKIDEKGLHYDPHFKPEFDEELLRNVNYISHICAVKRSLLLKTGLLNEEYDGAQDYDFILRASEKAEKIIHIPEVLYHWRCHKGSTASDMSAKEYAVDAGKRALLAHLERLGVEAEVSAGKLPGSYRVNYAPSKRDLFVITTYPNTLPKLEPKDLAGKLVLFMGKDVKINAEVLDALMRNCERSDVGAVGAVSICGGSCDQGGYVLGVGETFAGVPCNQPGYMGRLYMSRSVSALSDRCMMVDGDILSQLMIDETMGQSWHRDLALRISQAGKRVIILPEQVIIEKPYPQTEDSEAFVKKYRSWLDKWYSIAFSHDRPGYEME